MMTRETLDRIVNELKDEILTLESMVRQATLESVDALVTRDYKASRRIYNADDKINVRRFDLETNCIVAIATQQPMAVDIRALASILEISTELERMGDYAKGIARINLMLEGRELLEPIRALPDMAALASDMLHRAVQAFVNADLDEARAIPALDDQVDAYHNQISHGLIQAITKNADLAEMANTLQWAVHNIERMADRVINICERTVYLVTGRMYEFESTDDEYSEIE